MKIMIHDFILITFGVLFMNTGLTYKEGQFEQFALDIGGVVAEGPQTATHLISLDFIKRTPKVIRIKS